MESKIRLLAGFYENELINRFLTFWMPRCVDERNGGFFNCFDNEGKNLISTDKYTWSQGRFVWIFAKLASTTAPVFSRAQRDHFLQLARQGAEFLKAHCLLPGKEAICTFLMDEKGEPKLVAGCDRYDMSIYADCFVIAGMALYAAQSGDEGAYHFAWRLYESVLNRVQHQDFQTLPYPLSPHLRSHGIPMILSNVAREIYFAAQRFAPDECQRIQLQMAGFTSDILNHFLDEDGLIHEVILADGGFFPQLLGQHINPGHSIEDAWFMLDCADCTGHPEWKEKIYHMVQKSLEMGWDEPCGGLLHYAGMKGGEPRGDNAGYENEPMSAQLSGWGDKLWWPHSEALYTTMRCYMETGNEIFWKWHQKIFDYVYQIFPQPDPEIFEWMQIRLRDGRPCEKVVALPVKDPYHVIRNLILLLELLYRE